MTSDLIEKLNKLPPSQFTRLTGANPKTIKRVEERYEMQFPEDFREIMLWSNGFGMGIGKSPISVKSIENLESLNSDEEIEEYLPDMFVIGSDNGGALYFFDPQGKLGHGNFSIFLVPQSEIGFDNAIFCGESFTVVIEASLNNESFFDRPRLSEESHRRNKKI